MRYFALLEGLKLPAQARSLELLLASLQLPEGGDLVARQVLSSSILVVDSTLPADDVKRRLDAALAPVRGAFALLLTEAQVRRVVDACPLYRDRWDSAKAVVFLAERTLSAQEAQRVARLAPEEEFGWREDALYTSCWRGAAESGFTTDRVARAARCRVVRCPLRLLEALPNL